jgi:hypothetical protein
MSEPNEESREQTGKPTSPTRQLLLTRNKIASKRVH